MMERQLTYLVQLVDDPLDLARINTGKIQLKKSMVLLRDVMLSAVETTLPGIVRPRTGISVYTCRTSRFGWTPTRRLAQVISNECPKSAARPQPVQRRRRCQRR